MFTAWSLTRRVSELCDRHADADIGFVDASVLAIVERLDEPRRGMSTRSNCFPLTVGWLGHAGDHKPDAPVYRTVYGTVRMYHTMSITV